MSLQQHIVQQGECLATLAQQYGVPWRRIWEAAENRQLRERRRNPNVLQPGDRVVIPQPEYRHEQKPADARHRFKVTRVPVRVRIKIVFDGTLQTGQPFCLEVANRMYRGTVDQQGFVIAVVAPGAAEGWLWVGPDETPVIDMPVALGHLDPETSVAGLQKRLANLGFRCAVSGDLDEVTRAALRRFQEQEALPGSGEPDERTQAALLHAHGS